MKTTFLGQGLEPDSINAVGYQLIASLNSADFHSFTGISAFASEAGVFGLAQHIKSVKQAIKKFTLIVGIDQEGTSKEALYEILNLNVDGYIFYQKEAPIFHPKIYLFEGENHTKVVIGSSNLTGRGLFTNVESSIMIEFDNNDREGNALLAELKSYYRSLFDISDPNLFKISKESITYFIEKGLVPDEVTRRERYSKEAKVSKPSTKFDSGLIKIPRRPTARIPQIFLSKGKKSLPKTVAEEVESREFIESLTINGDFQERNIVWKSGPLTERDLNIPKGTNTNPTGSILLKKGQMEGIDQRHYFRDVVFASLPWANDSKLSRSHLERATAFFHFIVNGVDYGILPLILTHNTKTNSKTYLQNNSMTSLSWGKAKSIVAIEGLIGKIAILYKTNAGNYYTLVIE